MSLSIDPKSTWAILIGVSIGKFQGKELPTVSAVKHNLDKLSQLLKEVVGIPQENIIPLENKHRNELLTQVKDRPKLCNTLIIYYVGHGMIDNKTNNLYLVATDTEQSDLATAFTFAELWERTYQKATNLWYILDCCYSGLAFKSVSLETKKNIAVLTATLANEPARSQALHGELCTPFTENFLKLLEKGISNGQATLTPRQTFDELKKSLLKQGYPQPDFKNSYHDGEGSWHFANNRGYKLPGSDSTMPLYLLIALELKTKRPKTYLFRAWLKERSDFRRITLEKENVSLREVPTLIESVLRRIQTDIKRNNGKLNIEFFLPTDLLNDPIEEWKPGSDYPIGVDYCVVVRPLERIIKYDRQIRLHRHWKPHKLQNTVEKCAEWLETEDCCLLSHLDNGVVFFGLNFVPDTRFLKELVNSCAPMALWIRDKAVKQRYDEFCRCPLDELPEYLRKRRTTSWGQHKHTGHLSLMWDDPNRVPQELQENFRLSNFEPSV